MSADGLDVKDDVPTFADNVTGPGVVAHHDAMIFGVTAGRDNCATVPGRVRRRQPALFLVQPGQVIVGKLLERVQRYNVPAIDFNSAVVEAFHDAVEFALKLNINFRPEKVARGVTIELPI